MGVSRSVFNRVVVGAGGWWRVRAVTSSERCGSGDKLEIQSYVLGDVEYVFTAAIPLFSVGVGETIDIVLLQRFHIFLASDYQHIQLRVQLKDA